MKIIIEAVPIKQARLACYAAEGYGDWYYDRVTGDLRIQVMTEGDCDVIDRTDLFLIAWHELAEAILCRHAGVSQGAVDAFDMSFEGENPGGEAAAPYFRQHKAACIVESMLAVLLGRYDWAVE